MNFPIKKILFIVFLMFLLTLPLAVTFAQDPPTQTEPNNTQIGNLENPLGSNALTPQQIYGRVIYSFMGVTGALALIMFVIGGIQWMTAAGVADRVKKGRDTLMWAVLGLIVIFSSYAILRAVLEALQF
jgi:hypothetical protein